MTRTTRALVAILASAYSGCGDNQDPEGASELWQALQLSEYRTWERAPGYPARQPSGAPHGNAVDIFINQTAAQAVVSPSTMSQWPTGTVIVKDGYDDGELELVAVMEKRLTGWYWAEYDGEGEALYSGKPDLCLDCHQSGSDFVRAFPLP